MAKSAKLKFESYDEFEKHFLPDSYKERQERRRLKKEIQGHDGNELGILLASKVLSTPSVKKISSTNKAG